MKYRKKTHTKTDTSTSDLAWGWYNKEDMVKILKWSTTLILICSSQIEDQSMFLVHQDQSNLYTFNMLPPEEEDHRCHQML